MYYLLSLLKIVLFNDYIEQVKSLIIKKMTEAKDQQFDYNEQKRSQALRDYNMASTTGEIQFDALAELAQTICDTEIALISFIDNDRQWFKSKIGLDLTETLKIYSFCQYTIKGDEVYEVRDATKEHLFRNNPLVTGDPYIRFYAGAPLRTFTGYRMGTLCVIDSRPKSLTKQQKRSLALLADQVVDQMELKRSLAKQMEISEQKEKLALMVSHQFRNPVTAIQSNTELIKLSIRELTSETEIDILSYCEKINEQTKDMVDMLDDVLLFGQITSASSDKKLKSIGVQAFCKKIVNDMNVSRADRRKAQLDLAKHPLSIEADERELSHVIKNLLSNAFKYSSESPVLKVYPKKGHLVNIEIKDKGIGIPKNEQEFLFQPYFRASNVRGIMGTGLGLSITKELIQNNGGEIDITSSSNKGTTAIITLPTTKNIQS